MKVEKILNNNVIVFLDENGKENIAMGRGLAFKRKIGDIIANESVEKVFTLNNNLHHVEKLIQEIPEKYFQVGDEIFKIAKVKLAKKINANNYLFMVDHIYGACSRAKENIFIKNPLLWDIKRFYPEEYEVSKMGLNIIKEKLGIDLKEDEAGFLTLNIVNYSSENKEEIYEITKLMQEVCNIIRREFNKDLDEKSVYFYRFITHLKFFATRLINNETYQDNEDELFEVIKAKYVNAYNCVDIISNFIKKRYHYDLSNEEKLYLTIHIERMVYK